MVKTLPYHEWVLGAINGGSYVGMHDLAQMVKEVTIPIGHHDEILAAWNRKVMRLGIKTDLGVPAAILEQKQEAEKMKADEAFAHPTD